MKPSKKQRPTNDPRIYHILSASGKPVRLTPSAWRQHTAIWGASGTGRI